MFCCGKLKQSDLISALHTFSFIYALNSSSLPASDPLGLPRDNSFPQRDERRLARLKDLRQREPKRSQALLDGGPANS